MWVSKHRLQELHRDRMDALELYWQESSANLSLTIDLQIERTVVTKLQERVSNMEQQIRLLQNIE